MPDAIRSGGAALLSLHGQRWSQLRRAPDRGYGEIQAGAAGRLGFEAEWRSSRRAVGGSSIHSHDARPGVGHACEPLSRHRGIHWRWLSRPFLFIRH